MDNQTQIEFWNGAAGDQWARYQADMDRMLAPLGQAAVDALAPRAGERVLDVGCGCGHTSLQLAERGARVTGVDVSGPMLAHARHRASEAGQTVEFQEADASTATFAQPFDALFSRFGVMFFADPGAAFTHLHGQLAAKGRLAFVCWQAPALNPWVSEPVQIMQRTLKRLEQNPPAQPPPDPTAPGPFAFADSDRVTGLLDSAGFSDISIAPFETDLRLGGDVAEALRFFDEIGPAARMLQDLDAQARETVRTEMANRFKGYARDDGVFMASSAWIVTARA